MKLIWTELFIVTFTAPKRKATQAAQFFLGKNLDEVIIGFGNEEFDREGRYVEVALII